MPPKKSSSSSTPIPRPSLLSRLEFARLNRRLYLGSLSPTELADYSTVEQSMLELLPLLSIETTASSSSATESPQSSSSSSCSSSSSFPASSSSSSSSAPMASQPRSSSSSSSTSPPASTSSEPPPSRTPSPPQPTDIDTYVGTMPATVDAWRTVFRVMCAHKKFMFAPGEAGSAEAKRVMSLGYFAAREIEAHLLYNYAVHDFGREQAGALRQAVMTRDRDFTLTGRCVTTAKYRALNLPPTPIAAGKMASVSLATGERHEHDMTPALAAEIPPGYHPVVVAVPADGSGPITVFASSPPPPLSPSVAPPHSTVAPTHSLESYS